MLPIENSLAGAIPETYDLLAHAPLAIVAETVLPVPHCLVGLPETNIDALARVHSHPAALAQCRRFLSSLPDTLPEVAPSTAAAARRVAEAGDRGQAAISSRRAAARFGLTVLLNDVSDHAENYTRFVSVATHTRIDRDGGRLWHTAVRFVTHHHPGALLSAIEPLARYGVNMASLQSRPIPGRPWNYQFYADLEGHPLDAAVATALRVARGERGRDRLPRLLSRLRAGRVSRLTAAAASRASRRATASAGSAAISTPRTSQPAERDDGPAELARETRSPTASPTRRRRRSCRRRWRRPPGCAPGRRRSRPRWSRARSRRLARLARHDRDHLAARLGRAARRRLHHSAQPARDDDRARPRRAGARPPRPDARPRPTPAPLPPPRRTRAHATAAVVRSAPRGRSREAGAIPARSRRCEGVRSAHPMGGHWPDEAGKVSRTARRSREDAPEPEDLPLAERRRLSRKEDTLARIRLHHLVTAVVLWAALGLGAAQAATAAAAVHVKVRVEGPAATVTQSHPVPITGTFAGHPLSTPDRPRGAARGRPPASLPRRPAVV